MSGYPDISQVVHSHYLSLIPPKKSPQYIIYYGKNAVYESAMTTRTFINNVRVVLCFNKAEGYVIYQL
jgi:hypothetical protein